MLKPVVQNIPLDLKPHELLSATGWFYLRDVFMVLDPERTDTYKLAFKQMTRIIDRGEDPFLVMGRKKIGGRVGVLMERFAPWYTTNPIFQTLKLEKGMDFQSFLAQRDCFFRLSEVCKCYKDFLPYSYGVLKRSADKRLDPLNEVGIVKSDTTYLVALPRFQEWLREQLLG